MRKFLVALMVVTFAVAASASLLVTDDFAVSGALTDNGWVAYSGADASVTSDGSVASVGSGAEDIRLSFADQGTGPTYVSFTLNITTMPSSGGEYCFGMIDGSTMDSRWGLVSEGSGTGFGVTSYGAGTTMLDTFSGLSLSTDYLITYFFDGTDDHRLWIDSDGTDFATPDLQETAANSGIDGMFIRQAGGLDNGLSDWSIDNAIATTTFAEAIPEPTTAALFGLAVGVLAIMRKRK